MTSSDPTDGGPSDSTPDATGPTTFVRRRLAGAEFRDSDLRGARFVGVALNDAVLRGVDVAGAEIDSPWLLEEGGRLLVNGVDVVPLVDAELDRRFPGRSLRRARDPEGLRAAWEALQATWTATIARAEAMPHGTVDARVAGEWSLAQTLRHLVMATDTWLGRAVLELAEPYDRLGQPDSSYAAEGGDLTIFDATTPGAAAPSWDQVRRVREERVAMVGDFLAAVTHTQLDEPRRSPWDPEHAETVRSCLHTILEEEWEHHRYAVRDLEVIGRG